MLDLLCWPGLGPRVPVDVDGLLSQQNINTCLSSSTKKKTKRVAKEQSIIRKDDRKMANTWPAKDPAPEGARSFN